MLSGFVAHEDIDLEIKLCKYQIDLERQRPRAAMPGKVRVKVVAGRNLPGIVNIQILLEDYL